MDTRFVAIVAVACCIAGPAFSQTSDQHSVEGVAAALTSSLSTDAITKAREFDDQLLAEGRADNRRVYLVTDERSRKVNNLTRKLLVAMGHDPKAWTVRVLDTTPPMNNAFVVGGQYVYVFTGFLAATQSDDEIAFVLGHELGHSLLKHGERKQNDFSMQFAQLAVLIGALAKGKTAQEIGMFGEVLGAQYSQQDEAEADALGAAIALRAGFDPLRGTDFFTRMVKERDAAAPGAMLAEGELEALRGQATEALDVCSEWTIAWNNGQIAKTQQNADQSNKACALAENLRVSFNQANAEFYDAKVQESLQKLTGTHPSSQSRVAALAATVDFLAGRRSVDSLAKYENAHLVMQALQTTDSVLLRPADVVLAADVSEKTILPSSRDELAVRLEKLRTAFDSGLITQEEYDSKRKEILSQL